jgi:hypothetical protein
LRARHASKSFVMGFSKYDYVHRGMRLTQPFVQGNNGRVTQTARVTPMTIELAASLPLGVELAGLTNARRNAA